ncbi:MAG TPA: hypothetical protein VK694_07715 [Verrucomicrobiae bacterium]|nr:hypothetical protein [Verrucomicrobiae bacterium]
MATVYLKGRRRQLSPDKAIGAGGEAYVYDLGDGTVLKLYKQPNDPSYATNPAAPAGAIQRLQEQQLKLPAFPKGLPAQVVTPIDLAYDGNPGSIVGYTMQYLRSMEVLLAYADQEYRETGGIDHNQVVQIYTNLHSLVQQIHSRQAVIGDFNDLNVLVDQNDQVYLVDADSMQFGKFMCRAFTFRFVDPLVCEPNKLEMAHPHSPDSDWYAFNVMLFQSLLFVGPYGGIHRPPKRADRLEHDDRVLARLSVFHPSVQYPKPALPMGHLPDELLQHFQQVYDQDRRGTFPENLLRTLRWTACTNCGIAHARPICPACAAPGIVKQTVVKRGTVTATRIHTTGRLLHVVFQANKLRYLYHENQAFRREDGTVVASGKLDSGLRFRIAQDTTLLGKRERLLVFEPGATPQVQSAEVAARDLTMFDANERNYFWLQNGQLVRNGRLGPDYIGTVLSGRTLFWTGNRFGFGFYQAGQISRAFVFDTQGTSLNDQVQIPTLPGQLIDATCVFSDQLAWFMVSLQENGRRINRCYVINKNGDVVGELTADQDESTWLAASIRGRLASGSSLFAATDEGIVQVTVENHTISVAQTFPDTEPFVDDDTQLLAGNGGIYAVSTRKGEIIHLQIQ